MSGAEPMVIAVVGGGFAGASLAYDLCQLPGTPARIVVFEPRPALGSGLAYSTSDPNHRINVPAAKMSLLPGDETHFAGWLGRHGLPVDDAAATLADGRCFPARALFGRYVAEQVAPLLASGQVRHRQAGVSRIETAGDGYLVTDEAGETLIAGVVAIATSHPPPSPPPLLREAFDGAPGFVTDPWALGALAGIGREARVLIVGTGLTMADVVASLSAQGHKGKITAISRRGQRSRGHTNIAVEPEGEFLTHPSLTALALLRRIRAAVRQAAAAGRSWHGLFDTLRAQGGGIWRALPFAERMRLIRHLRPFWDTHRFRVAPQIEAVLERRIAGGSLAIKAGRVILAKRDSDNFRVALRYRNGVTCVEHFDAVVATTGPAHDTILSSQPFMHELAQNGLLQLDPTRLGILVDRCSRAVGSDGAIASLFVIGPLARGTFGELMGLPEVAKHSSFVAAAITDYARRAAKQQAAD